MGKNKNLLYLFVILFFGGCGGTINYFKDMKSNFHSSYHTKNSMQNSQKDKKIFQNYMQQFKIDQITKFDNKLLSKKEGKLGLWLPSKFIETNGGGLYLLKPYQENKIPIVFIHGAGGNGKDWEYIIQSLNHNKYQPIIVSYPSGVRLQLSAEILTQSLLSFSKKHKINEYIVIAHSMGGLVAKKSIQLLNKKQNLVQTFISIATPWNGHEGAKNVKKLPFFIPSWNDMRTNSEFINTLKDRDILKDVNHYLLFGFKGDDTMFSRDNDGVISLSSQLSKYAQFGAKKVYGLNENHIGILISKDVTILIDKILNNKLQ